MPNRLKGKRAVVTAAAAGIGRACALAFAREGASVIATDINEVGIASLTKEGIAETARLDVRNTADVNAFAKRVGKIDILLNAAGFVHHGTIMDCSDEDWDFSFDLNVKSMHRTIRAFLPGMLERRRGSIINMSSAVSSIRGVPDRYVYGATKAAVIGLTKAVAADFIKQGIRCNAICPGTIESPSLDERMREVAKTTGKPLAAVEQAFIARQPMGRLGKPAEVAQLAVFLASDESSYITGQPHLVDGGMAL